MAWNEPGGGNNRPNDPWGKGNNKNQGPPDLDELLSKFFDRLNGFFGGGKGSGGDGGMQGPNKTVAVLIAVALFILYGVAGFTVVVEGERGVIQTFGEHHKTVGSGPIFVWRPIQKLTKVDVESVNSIDSGRYSRNEREMLTKDENIVIVRYNVQYKIDNAENFLFRLDDPVEALYQVAESSVREVIGQTNMDQITTEQREEVVREARRRTQQVMDDYRAGIKITAFNFADARYPDAVQSAIDDVTKAREDHVRFINEAEAYRNQLIPEARGEAVQLVEQAKGYQARVVETAEGQAARFNSLYAEYRKAPRVTRDRLYLDAVQSVMESTSKVMVDTKDGNNMIYLPLDKIMQQHRDTSSGSSQSGSSSNSSQSSSSGSKNSSRSDLRTRTREVR
ncbi:MAG: FtsH protease activity modulator HflK [Pseudomonadota bacterium]